MASRYGLAIRACTPTDAAALAALLAKAGRSIGEVALAQRLAAVRQAGGTTLLALEWGPPSGAIGLTWFPTLAADHPVALITLLLVDPDDRRRGIGRLLLKSAAQAARSAGCGSLHLPSSPGDTTIAAFAAATGFDEDGPAFTRSLRKRGAGGEA